MIVVKHFFNQPPPKPYDDEIDNLEIKDSEARKDFVGELTDILTRSGVQMDLLTQTKINNIFEIRVFINTRAITHIFNFSQFCIMIIGISPCR